MLQVFMSDFFLFDDEDVNLTGKYNVTLDDIFITRLDYFRYVFVSRRCLTA